MNYLQLCKKGLSFSIPSLLIIVVVALIYSESTPVLTLVILWGLFYTLFLIGPLAQIVYEYVTKIVLKNE